MFAWLFFLIILTLNPTLTPSLTLTLTPSLTLSITPTPTPTLTPTLTLTFFSWADPHGEGGWRCACPLATKFEKDGNNFRPIGKSGIRH